MNDLIFVQKQADGKLAISGKCVFCQNEHKIKNVSEEGYNNWKRGDQIVKALPEVTIDDAEFLVSGVCPTCWDETFGVGKSNDDACHHI